MTTEKRDVTALPLGTARDINSDRDPHDWIIEVCAVCGCQLGPGIGSRTRTGRCVYEEHRSVGGTVVRVTAKPDAEQGVTSQRYLPRIREAMSR